MITVKCIKTWSLDFLTIGKEYEAKIINSNTIELIGDDEEYHSIEIHYFELIRLEKQILDIINIYENFNNQKSVANSR